MTIYRGQPRSGKFAAIVEVERDGSKTRLHHHVRHSPAGFDWGHHGDAPKELAMCILWDHLGFEPHAILYQKFKVDFIAKASPQGFTIRSEQIESWLEKNRDLPRVLQP